MCIGESGEKMKKIKMLKKWGIYELTLKEQYAHGFTHAVIHPDLMESYQGGFVPSDTDMEMQSLDQAIDWVRNYRNH